MMSWWHEIWISEAKVAMWDMSLVSIMYHSILQEFSSCEMRINRHAIPVVLWAKSVWSFTKEWINIDTSKTMVLLHRDAMVVSGLIEIMVSQMEVIVEMRIWTMLRVVIMVQFDEIIVMRVIVLVMIRDDG